MFENLSENDRLREFVRELADKIGLDEDRKQALDIAASLLGVGRLPVVDIMEKKGARSPEEVARMRDIPAIWADFTDQLAPLKALGVPDIVQAYCENWDGSGYPKGLAGTEIPLGARVLAVCYHYNGMISDRAHRAALPHDDAACEIRRMSGRMLDPALVETFIAMVEEKRKAARMMARRQAEEELPESAGASSASDQVSRPAPQPAGSGQAREAAGRAAEPKVKEKPVSARKASGKRSARRKAGAGKKAKERVKKKAAKKKPATKKRPKKQAARKVVKKKAAKKKAKKTAKKVAAKKAVTKKAAKKKLVKKRTAKKKK